MKPAAEMLIRVHGSWNGWQTAEVRLGDIHDVHWLQPGSAPHPLVHGFVSCSSIVNGGIPHDCEPASAPHAVRVCVLKKHAIESAYLELVRRADLKPRPGDQHVRAGELSGGARI
jgi:hypothetical protein